ncbi:MAG: fimbrial chaperone protein [Thiomicrorhabdus sp.]|nr:MAG: fimbrial chaperone protein [Thiomicrorhabdus sp.]
MLKASLIISKFVLFILFFQSTAQASLLIAPLRVNFEDRERSKTVIIMNTGKTTNTYRIGFKNMQQLPDGEYKNISSEEEVDPSLFFADDMIRFSPRQVTLKPGARQQIRLSLRKPENLESGDYRSHLAFTQLPNPDMLESRPENQGIKLYMLTSFSIPVLVRQGQLSINSKIMSARINKTKHDTWQVEVDVSREGNFSTFGKLIVFWRPNASSSYQELNFLDNSTLYRETKRRTINIALKESQVQSGQFKVVYEPHKSFKIKTFDEFEFYYP